jgi:hypothetical protein
MWFVCRKKSTRSARLDEIRLLKEPAQAGKVQAVVRMLAGFVVVTEPDNGSKVVRAERVAAPGQSLKIIFDRRRDRDRCVRRARRSGCGRRALGRTVLSKLLKALIDPNAAPVRALSREQRELMIAANNSYLIRMLDIEIAFGREGRSGARMIRMSTLGPGYSSAAQNGGNGRTKPCVSLGWAE